MARLLWVLGGGVFLVGVGVTKMKRRNFLKLGLFSALAYGVGCIQWKVLPQVFEFEQGNFHFHVVRTFRVLSYTRKHNNTHTRLYTTVTYLPTGDSRTWDINSHVGEDSCWKTLSQNIKTVIAHDDLIIRSKKATTWDYGSVFAVQHSGEYAHASR